MDISNIFTRLNQETAKFEADRGPLAKDFASQLFKAAPWYLAAFKNSFDKEEVKEKVNNEEDKNEDKKEIPLQVQQVEPQLIVPQVEKNLKLEGGELHCRHEEGLQVLTLNEDLPEKMISYSEAVDNCSLCPEQAISKRLFVVNELDKINFKSPFKVLFVGDCPKKIPEQKECFPGEGGELLKKMITAMKLSEGEYACTLAIKCFRSTEDSLVFDQMAKHCLKNFYREIGILKPQVVIPLGAVAANLLLARKERMAQIHGQSFAQKIIFNNTQHDFLVIPTFHPDFLMSSPSNKKVAWEDLQKVMKIIGNL